MAFGSGPSNPNSAAIKGETLPTSCSSLCLVRLPLVLPLLRQIGNLSSKTRVVRIKNVLTSQEDTIEVPSEEMVVEIRER